MNWRIFTICFTFFIDTSNAAVRPRIIGGENARIEEFPYLVSIRDDKGHICGGTIISDIHILTAAHCITIVFEKFVPPYDKISINTGTSSSIETGESHKVAEIFMHPEYVDAYEASYNKDVAIIKLASKIHFNERQQKIKLVNHEVETQIQAVLAGWGRTAIVPGTDSTQLQKLTMTVISSKDCQDFHAQKIYKEQLCAFQKPGHGSCYGDSGGPLVVDQEVIGILSWISEDGFAIGTAEVFASVYALKDFIESVMER